jgi:hypothetical protein
MANDPDTSCRRAAIGALSAGMTDAFIPQPRPEATDRAEFVRRLVASRCPELDEGEIASFSAMSNTTSATTSDVQPILMVDREVGERILDVLSALDQRLDAIERLVGERA